MYQLDEISFIFLGLIIPILFFLIFRGWQKKSIRKYFDINTIKFLSPEISNSKPLLKFIIISIALLMLVISLVNPNPKSETPKYQIPANKYYVGGSGGGSRGLSYHIPLGRCTSSLGGRRRELKDGLRRDVIQVVPSTSAALESGTKGQGTKSVKPR